MTPGTETETPRRRASGRTAQKQASGAKPITLQSIAHRMMKEAEGDIEEAAVAIFEYCAAHPRLADELGMMAARSLAQQVTIAARQTAQAARADAASYGGTTPQGKGKVPHKFTPAILAAQRRAQRSGASNANALLNDPYTIGGISKPLRDWHGTTIRDHGEQQLSRGKTQIRNANFLIMVGEAAGKALIGKKLDESTVAKFRAEADALE